jgi:predicted TIM-barrel fold metal-dependent hydrolase
VDLAKALVSFDRMNFKDAVKEKLLLANARNLFGLPAE